VTVAPLLDLVALEKRRRLAFRAALIAAGVALVSFPIGTRIGGSERADTIGGAFLFAALVGVIASPWIVRAWQIFMGRRMIAAAVAARPDISHIDGEFQQPASQRALSSDAFSLAAFRDSGLVEAFESAGVRHVLSGDTHGVPFAIAEINLLDPKGYRVFSGVLASFRLSRPRSGLTIVTRDRGFVGNLLLGAGSAVERLPLEDPTFEGVFEVYGTDQVGGRVVLTTTMLERLKALDQIAHAHGFACAFRDQYLLVALRGMTWRCPAWRIVQPVSSWLQIYAAWLAGLVDLPVDIVRTLNIGADASIAAAAGTVRPALTSMPPSQSSVAVGSADGQVFSSSLWRIVGDGGTALISVASGALFGGLALFGAWYGITVGYTTLFWYFWSMIAAGIVYGAYAISIGVRDIARLAWKFNAPLRTLQRRERN
jgi:hypothetical protein